MSVIEVGNGSFIAGEAAPTPLGYERCYCGDGLEYDMEGYLTICYACGGSGVGARLHPLVRVVTDPYTHDSGSDRG